NGRRCSGKKPCGQRGSPASGTARRVSRIGTKQCRRSRDIETENLTEGNPQGGVMEKIVFAVPLHPIAMGLALAGATILGGATARESAARAIVGGLTMLAGWLWSEYIVLLLEDELEEFEQGGLQ